jgi:hypothetical protein
VKKSKTHSVGRIEEKKNVQDLERNPRHIVLKKFAKNIVKGERRTFFPY